MDVHKSNPRVEKHWRWAAFILGPIMLSVGCGPATLLNYFMMQEKMPAQYELKSSKKEVTVALNTFFAKLQVREELRMADSELNKKIAQHLQARFKANGDPIKIIDDAKSRQAYNQPANALFNTGEMGKECGADYVINVEIASLSLRKEKSWDQFFEGNAEIRVSVTRVENGDFPDWEKEYRISYPESGPIYASDMSPAKFRADFLNRIAVDISRYFARFPREERMVMHEK